MFILNYYSMIYSILFLLPLLYFFYRVAMNYVECKIVREKQKHTKIIISRAFRGANLYGQKMIDHLFNIQ